MYLGVVNRKGKQPLGSENDVLININSKQPKTKIKLAPRSSSWHIPISIFKYQKVSGTITKGPNSIYERVLKTGRM